MSVERIELEEDWKKAEGRLEEGWKPTDLIPVTKVLKDFNCDFQDASLIKILTFDASNSDKVCGFGGQKDLVEITDLP